MNLDTLRKKIGMVDTRIVELIAQRQSHAPAVAKYKKENGLPIFQPKREKEILKVQKSLARKFKVDPKLVEKIFILIMKDSRRIQKRVTQK